MSNPEDPREGPDIDILRRLAIAEQQILDLRHDVNPWLLIYKPTMSTPSVLLLLVAKLAWFCIKCGMLYAFGEFMFKDVILRLLK